MRATKFGSERLAFHAKMAGAYHDFLTYVFIKNAGNEALQKGVNEFRNKFLSCFFIENAPIPEWFTDNVLSRYRGANRRYLLGDYYSEKALDILGSGESPSGKLRFEHVLPKGVHVKSVCEAGFVGQKPIGVKRIQTLLDQCWHIAVITTEEDELLYPHRRMPDGWKVGDDVLARYRDTQGKMRFDLLCSFESAAKCKKLLGAGRTRQ